MHSISRCSLTSKLLHSNKSTKIQPPVSFLQHNLEITSLQMLSKEPIFMDSAHENGGHNNEIQEEAQRTNGGNKLGDYIPIYIPAIQKGLLNQSRHEKEERFLDFLKAHPSNEWVVNVLEQNSIPEVNSSSPSDPATHHVRRRRRRFRVPFSRKINWSSLWKSFKRWIKGPEHIALFIWLLFVAAGVILLFLVMTGILNEAIPSQSRRDDWSEIINQILNALFTMMALYEHPKFFHHLVLLLRWRPGEEAEVRKVYCKNGVPKPNERAHMLIVVTLLHITCFSQYVLCGLYWGFTRKTRPDWAENLSIAVGIAAPIMAVLYTIYSPLGRASDEPTLTDEELQNQPRQEVDSEEIQKNIIITSPEWIGGLFDCRDDMTVTCLSFFCTFCVFGWNMERLGFGNMYVHIATFILLCVGPFWVFAISALNVNDDTIKLILVIAGSLFSVLGLLYAGFWRTEMRKKFKLPGNPFCCTSTVTDYIQWLFCWPCSLAQEVRTANFYDIEDDGFYRTVTDEEGREVVIPLPREGNMGFVRNYSRSVSCPGTMEPVRIQRSIRPINFERALTVPAPQPLIRVEEERPLRNIELSDRTI